MEYTFEDKNERSMVKNVERDIIIEMPNSVLEKSKHKKELIKRKVYALVGFMKEEREEYTLFVRNLNALLFLEKERKLDKKVIYRLTKIQEENVFFNLGLYTDQSEAFDIKVKEQR